MVCLITVTIKLEVEYLLGQLELLDGDKATKLLITQLVTYLDHLTSTFTIDR